MQYLYFFAGFPFAEVDTGKKDTQSGERANSAIELISNQTGINTRILQGIDVAQQSISTVSKSDMAQFSRESVLGLLQPLINSERIAHPHRAKDLPAEGVLRGLCALAHRKTEDLEALA